ncbi:MAG TPA: DUF58 domain-containing protein [Caldilineae bacterium]|nr:DUF58 domain-containing protein [Caldilineae bacterium]
MDIPFLIILLFALFILLRIEFIFYIVYVLFGTWVVAQWWTNRAAKQIAVRRFYSDHAFLGERVRVRLQIQNQGRLPIPWVRISESVPLVLHSPNFIRRVISLPSRGQVTITYTLDCRRRGYYALGPASLTTGDLFGFAESRLREPREDHITVYPRIIPLSRLGITSQLPFGTVRTPQRLFEDPTRMIGLRDYQAGDPLHRIHWKASAHAGDLLVTKLDAAISLETAILLNLNAADYEPKRAIDISEWAIVVAASIAHHLAERRQPVGLFTNGYDPLGGRGRAIDLPPRSGRGHLMKVLEVLARIELSPDGAVPFASWIQGATVDLGWGTTVIVITPKGDAATCQALHRLQRAGLNVVLIVVGPSGRFRETRQRARHFGFPAYLAARERDLDAWRSPAPMGWPVR